VIRKQDVIVYTKNIVNYYNILLSNHYMTSFKPVKTENNVHENMD